MLSSPDSKNVVGLWDTICLVNTGRRYTNRLSIQRGAREGHPTTHAAAPPWKTEWQGANININVASIGEAARITFSLLLCIILPKLNCFTNSSTSCPPPPLAAFLISHLWRLWIPPFLPLALHHSIVTSFSHRHLPRPRLPPYSSPSAVFSLFKLKINILHLLYCHINLQLNLHRLLKNLLYISWFLLCLLNRQIQGASSTFVVFLNYPIIASR